MARKLQTGSEAKIPHGASSLSLVQQLSYGFGDFGFNLFFTTASLYLLFYYTDVLGLDPATAGWVFAAALVWDALFDPLMGYIATKTRTRWGRYRPQRVRDFVAI